MNVKNIKKLKIKGFFELTPLKQIELLEEYDFFKLAIEKRIK